MSIKFLCCCRGLCLILHPAYCAWFAHAQVFPLFYCKVRFVILPPPTPPPFHIYCFMFYVFLFSYSLLARCRLMWQGDAPYHDLFINVLHVYLLVLCTSVCTCILVHFWHYVMLVNSRILCLCCLVYVLYVNVWNQAAILFMFILLSFIFNKRPFLPYQELVFFRGKLHKIFIIFIST
jgi:hypothetical protein